MDAVFEGDPEMPGWVIMAVNLLAFRGEDRPTLSAVARLMNRAAGLLPISDLDERLGVENAATIALAQKLRLIS